MASRALKDFIARHGGKEPPYTKQSALKSFNARQAVDYSA